jgi:hypothetical protein
MPKYQMDVLFRQASHPLVFLHLFTHKCGNLAVYLDYKSFCSHQHLVDLVNSMVDKVDYVKLVKCQQFF